MTVRRAAAGLAGAALATLLAASGTAGAQEDAGLERRPPETRLDRPLGVAEVGVGWLVLPGADVCTERGTGACTKGDSSPTLEVSPLYRATQRFEVGASITLGLIPTTDAPRQDPAGVTRDHRRSYLIVETVARYYPLVRESIEAWVGLTGGLVVVSDAYKPTAGTSDKALVGPRGVVIRTEGYTIGLATGIGYRLGTHWTVGGTLRYGNWFLPNTPATDPLGDEASLSGRNVMFSASLNVGYHVAL